MARRGASVKTTARLRTDEATRKLREAQSRLLAALGAAVQGYFEAAERRKRAQAVVEQEEAQVRAALRAVRELVETNKAAAELCGVSVSEVTAAMAAPAPAQPAQVPQPGPAPLPAPAPTLLAPVTVG